MVRGQPDQRSSLHGLVEGLHTVTVRAYDNVNLLPRSTVTFLVDTVDPTLTIDAPNDGSLISIDSATVSWTADDVTSGLQGTQYMLDGAGVVAALRNGDPHIRRPARGSPHIGRACL